MTGLDIKLEIVRQGKSQQKVARQAHIEATRLNRIVNGWLEPRPDEAERIRKALGLNEPESPKAA